VKPIEPGCLCVVIGPISTGSVLTVGAYIGAPPPGWERNLNNDFWEVASSSLDVEYASESWLMRIDGHEPETQDVPEELTA